MDSLAWVDQTYIAKHKGENPEELRAMYYPNLKQYENAHSVEGKAKEERAWHATQAFMMRFGKKAVLSLGVYFASFLPVVGRFVLPAASFYTFNKAVGTPAAVVIFGSGVVLPKRYLIMFLQSYFSSRTMMRELVHLTSINAHIARTLIGMPARPLLLSHTLPERSQTPMVPRPQRRTLRLFNSLLPLPEDPVGRRSHIRSRGSIDSLSDYEDYRTTATSIGREGVCTRGREMEVQERLLELTAG